LILDPLTSSERRALVSLLENSEMKSALERFLAIEASAWRTRLVNEALAPTVQEPVARICRQAEFAGRVNAYENVMATMKKKAAE
jgi:hypothetical protein